LAGASGKWHRSGPLLHAGADDVKKPLVLRPIHPSAGIRAAYRGKLLKLVDEMIDSYLYWVRAAYRKTPPRMAMDDVPARELEKALAALAKRWERNFDTASKELAQYFATKVENRSRRTLMSILKKGGFTVEFKMSAALRDVMTATVAENVSLIKSIPQQFHSQVSVMVMQSVTAGRDLAPLTRQLQKQFGVTRRRAELIARDQNSKATAQITRARYVDMGIKKAIWLHSGGGKTKRPTHVKNSGKQYDIAKGWFDPDPKVKRFIQPGELINCRCVPRPVVQGFS
jgi:SPP1 gp7 family putative phage head morphogenesis protein